MKRYPLYKDSKVKWLGNVPEHWKVVRLWGIADSFFKGNGITREDVFEDGDSPCIRYGDIYTKYNIAFSECKTRTNKARLATCIYLKHGDIAFTLTGELIEEIGKSIVYLGNEECLVGGDIAVLRHSQNPGFLGYYLACPVSQQQKSFGKTKLKVVHTKIGDLKNVVVSLPPELEQRAIVAYLDRAVEKIDGYIAAKEAEIEKLGTLKWTVVDQSISHGIDSSAQTKDSGIDWLGLIPEHWSIHFIKQHFRIQKRIAGKEGYKVLSITQTGLKVKDISCNEGQMAANYSGYQFVYPGEFAMNHMDLLTGGVGLSTEFGVTSPDYRVFELFDKKTCNPDYFLYVFQLCYKRRIFYRYGRGAASIGRWRLPAKEFLNFTIPIPPADEQQDIVAYISRKTQEIDGFIAKIRMQIDKLKLYKQRLISDVVTGKICVCESFEEAK